MNLEWKVTHLIPMNWETAKSFEKNPAQFRLPTLKELKQAYNDNFYGFDKINYWSSDENHLRQGTIWCFNFKRGIQFAGNTEWNYYIRLCKEIKD